MNEIFDAADKDTVLAAALIRHHYSSCSCAVQTWIPSHRNWARPCDLIIPGLWSLRAAEHSEDSISPEKRAFGHVWFGMQEGGGGGGGGDLCSKGKWGLGLYSRALGS